jgi:hypothetical protein
LRIDDADALAGQRRLASAGDSREAGADDKEIESHGAQLDAGACARFEAKAKRA